MKWLVGNRVTVLGIALGGLLALGWVDYLTAFEFELFLFYALPVAMVAWWVGRLAATLTAALAVATWFGANVLSANPYSSVFYAAWNTGLRGGWVLIVALTISQIRADLDRERQLNADLTTAFSQVRELQGLLPICAWCKKILNGAGYWEHLESYLRRHTRAEFTHGICPACAAAQMGEPPPEGK